jgi:WD40 repeat protein
MFHPDAKRLRLFSASEDSTVRAWDLHSNRGDVLENHMGAVSSLAFSADGNKEWHGFSCNFLSHRRKGAYLVSGGRDRVVNLWDAATLKHIRTIPVYESIEGVYVLPTVADASSSSKKNTKKGLPSQSNDAPDVPSLRIVTAGDKVHILSCIRPKDLTYYSSRVRCASSIASRVNASRQSHFLHPPMLCCTWRTEFV